MFDRRKMTVMIPPHHGTWVPLYRHLNPCSPAASPFAGAAEAKQASLTELQRHDQLRVDHIHRRMLSESDDVGVSKKATVKEPVLFAAAYLHDQPVIQVMLGSQSKSSEVRHLFLLQCFILL
jgi:hypothetical protein